MHDMPILHPLAAQGIRPHGKARPSPVRHGKSLDFLPAAAHLPQAQTGRAGNSAGQGYMACQAILTRTAKEWGVK